MAVLFNRAKANADNHLESRAIRLKAHKLNQMKSRARLSDRLKQRAKKMDKKTKTLHAVVADSSMPVQRKDKGEANTFTE